jgi:hypothetical protein
VSREANHLLQVMVRKYQLTPAQQQAVFPVIARAAPSYPRLAGLEGQDLSDYQLTSLGIVPQPVGTGSEEVAEDRDATQEATAGETATDDPAVSETPAARTASPTRAKAGSSTPSSSTDSNISLDELEYQLAPFLNPAQLAQMTPEQIDRYYWWGEILLQLSGDETNAAAAVSASSSGTATGDSADGSVPTGTGSEPTAYQGGRLFEMLGGDPVAQP